MNNLGKRKAKSSENKSESMASKTSLNKRIDSNNNQEEDENDDLNDDDDDDDDDDDNVEEGDEEEEILTNRDDEDEYYDDFQVVLDDRLVKSAVVKSPSHYISSSSMTTTTATSLTSLIAPFLGPSSSSSSSSSSPSSSSKTTAKLHTISNEQPHSPPPLVKQNSMEISDNAQAYPHLVLDEEMKTSGYWPARIYPYNSTERLNLPNDEDLVKLCERIVDNVFNLARECQQEENEPSAKWTNRGEILDIILDTTQKQQQLQKIDLVCKAAAVPIKQQKNIVSAQAPSKIFGDVHGQFRDLLLLLIKFGFPHHREGDIDLVKSYVFNGDWLDRGPHQLEIMMFLFSLKFLYPHRVYLVRGNHEFRHQNECMSAMGHNGFNQACATLGHPLAYELVHDVLEWLPIACVLEKKILIIHGGIGNGEWGLNELRDIYKRPVRCYYSDTTFTILNALWSDPIPESGVDQYIGGAHRNARDERRGIIRTFGMDLTKKFCALNGLSCIIRSHEVSPAGFKLMHRGRLISVFSARNYDGKHHNDGAVLLAFWDDAGDLRIRAKAIASQNNQGKA